MPERTKKRRGNQGRKQLADKSAEVEVVAEDVPILPAASTANAAPCIKDRRALDARIRQLLHEDRVAKVL